MAFYLLNIVACLQICKLFESVLLELVGEDGRGSSKLLIGADHMRQADANSRLLAAGDLTIIFDPREDFPSHTSLGSSDIGDETTAVDGSRISLRRGSRGKCFRGSAYHSALARYVRSLLSVDSCAVGKARDRAQHAFVMFVQTIAPTLPDQFLEQEEAQSPGGADLASTSTKKKSATNLAAGTTNSPKFHKNWYVPDHLQWQYAQLFLDVRASYRLQSVYDACSDDAASTKLAVLKCCARMLAFCHHIKPELRASDPFVSLAREFSSHGWVHIISEILKAKLKFPELSGTAVDCLAVMSHHHDWMRCWTLFDVLPILSFIIKQPASQLAEAKKLAHQALKQCALHRPEGWRAMVAARVAGFEDAAVAVTRVISEPVESLLEEANDLSFGSTLNEQAKFTDRLSSWVAGMFLVAVPTPNEYQGGRFFGDGIVLVDNFGDVWSKVFEVVQRVSAWIPKLCLSLHIHDGQQDAVKRERTHLSCSVASRQIAIIERVLLNALSIAHPQAIEALVACLWSSSHLTGEHDVLDHKSGG